MAVFRVEKNSGYTVMSNHHLRNRALSLKAKGLLSQMLSLPEDWDYTLQGLARINRESIDAIRQAIRELEQAGYIQRSRERDEKGRLRGADYVIFELPQPVPASVSPTLENPTLENPTQENPTLENPMQLNKDKLITEKQKKEGLNTDSIPIHSPNPLPLDEDETAASPPERTGSRKEAAYQIYRDLILENIEYDTLTQNPRIDREQLDEIVDILLETVCTTRKSIRVAGDDYPAELVKAKFLKLDSHHIEFVMDCLRDNTTKVRNIKQYLRAMLFNAPSTINSYYASLVAHDMAKPCAKKYGVDFTLRKDKTTQPPHYIVIFKAKDADNLEQAFREFTAKTLTKEQRPSIRKVLAAAKQKAAQQPKRAKEKIKQRGLER